VRSSGARRVSAFLRLAHAKEEKILVLNGPESQSIGQAAAGNHGRLTLDQINRKIQILAKELGVEVEVRQSNVGELVGWIQQAPKQFGAIVINPAAYTHSSVAIRDAISATGVPTVEIHISNIYRREEFRKQSYIAGAAVGQITGFGVTSYLLGLRAAAEQL
jgi:3-dehydroquinate dehydratase-2